MGAEQSAEQPAEQPSEEQPAARDDGDLANAPLPAVAVESPAAPTLAAGLDAPAALTVERLPTGELLVTFTGKESLGLNIEMVGRGQKKAKLLVRSIAPGSACAEIGLQPNSEVKAVNRMPAESVNDIWRQISMHYETRPLTLTILENGPASKKSGFTARAIGMLSARLVF